MANRDLLADAIADAKAVKEVAIANAKAALEEAFTPHLKDMLAQKINEMEDLDEDLELAEVDKEKVDEEKEVEEGYGKKDVDEAKDDLDEAEDVDEELDLEEILAELELEEEELEEQSGNIDPGIEPKSFLRKKPDHVQLEEEEDVKEGKKEDLDEGEDVEESYDKVDEAEDVVDDAEEEINLEDMSEDDLKSMIEDVIEDMIEDGELVPGPNADESEEEEAEDTDDGLEGDADVDIEVDDIDLEEGEDKDLEEGKEEKVDEEKEKMKEELEEAQAAIEQLRSDLNEVNLLNSKLLYTNKIFRNKNLTENQKIKVLKAFDKAETVKEAKTIFETLNENLIAKTAKTSIRESRGAASKPAGVAPKRAINESIVQEDAMVSRFKQLAGIK